jgi:fructuronate reductase
VNRTARLSREALGSVSGAIRRPPFDPAATSTGIVHIGLGAFARAHLATYTQDLLGREPRWGILGVSLRRADTYHALAPQDWLYCRAERGGGGERIEIMAPLTGIVVGAGAALHRLLDPAVRIVTLTVTEKGYCRDAASGDLSETDPPVRADLARLSGPDFRMGDEVGTVPALLVSAIRARWRAGAPPFAVLSCDNLPSNGAATQRVVTQLARLVDPDLGRYIEDDVAFPSCMVDRIVPATTGEDRGRIDSALGLRDAWPVVCEPFTQWVIEDRFPHGRPAWEEAGAELVCDVRPYENMKLRILNGSHSSIAYLGQLAGWQTVAEAIAQPDLAAYIAALMEEIGTTVRLPGSVDLAAYRRALLVRFANPALRHRTAQIAMDGSQKLPPRLFAPALERLAAGLPSPRIALGIAAWLWFLRGRSDDGSTLELNDPHKERLRQAALAASDPHALRDAIFAMSDIVPPDLAASAGLARDVTSALELLASKGAARTISIWNERATDSG